MLWGNLSTTVLATVYTPLLPSSLGVKLYAVSVTPKNARINLKGFLHAIRHHLRSSKTRGTWHHEPSFHKSALLLPKLERLALRLLVTAKKFPREIERSHVGQTGGRGAQKSLHSLVQTYSFKRREGENEREQWTPEQSRKKTHTHRGKLQKHINTNTQP